MRICMVEEEGIIEYSKADYSVSFLQVDLFCTDVGKTFNGGGGEGGGDA